MRTINLEPFMRVGAFIRKYRIVFIIIAVVVSVVGVVMVPQMVEKQYMYSVVMGSEGRKLIEDMLHRADPNALTDKGRIKSYRIKSDTIEHNPMGGIMVRIVLNNDPEMELHVIIEQEPGNDNLIAFEQGISGKAAEMYRELGALGD
ncbi:DUF1310 family protein [Alloscardovia theropitheci]|uniref:DUF1310 family protein n=1 Tax=Alloscardovia theropitheci TaxID=2496842 RepID=A0A4R0QVJ0_9BIFI|nr:DUF1310 family protein [Alloscardovia theropitheci]TCD54217.1 DUF1310 family protein [Alloscardovia theropitheci]